MAAIAVIVIVGAFLLIGTKKPTTETKSKPAAEIQNPTPKQSVTVTVGKSGFDPQTITIKPGTRVVWENASGGTVTVNSALHPTHSIYPPLNLGTFGDGASVQLVFDKSGTYKYHNHLDASQTGTIIVE